MPMRSNATGRFSDRETLEDIVLWLWKHSHKDMSEIGNFCGVSRDIVARIIHKRWEKSYANIREKAQ